MSRWVLGDKFNAVYAHKGSIKVLWETRWKPACQRSVYPFHDGCYEDFAPIFEKLIKDNINDAESDDYTNAFLPAASALESQAEDALGAGHADRASELFRRAAVVHRIARYPYVDVTQPTSLKRAVFERQKQVYMKAAALWTPPIKEETLTHSYSSGNDNQQVPIYVRFPETACPELPVPVVFIMTGLDGYRPDNAQRTQEAVSRGWAAVVVEIPGTADCPADPGDPGSPDRLWDSVFAYIESEPRLDSSKVVAWGLSAGGFYAIRAAHTHGTRLVGAVAHGPGCHFFLDPEWLSRVDDHEYPFTLTSAWAKKHGYADVETFKSEAQNKFSLVREGIVDQPSCRLLLLNGVDDGVVPIEDCYVLFNHGSAKEGRFFEGLPHMGYPHSLPVAYTWFEDLLSPPAAVKN